MKKGIKFLKIKNQEDEEERRGEEEEEEEKEEENYKDERTKHFLLHVTLFALLQIGFHSAFLNKWVEFWNLLRLFNSSHVFESL